MRTPPYQHLILYWLLPLDIICNISSQDVGKFTYLTLDKYILDEKCIKATSYIISINSLV